MASSLDQAEVSSPNQAMETSSNQAKIRLFCVTVKPFLGAWSWLRAGFDVSTPFDQLHTMIGNLRAYALSSIASTHTTILTTTTPTTTTTTTITTATIMYTIHTTSTSTTTTTSTTPLPTDCND